MSKEIVSTKKVLDIYEEECDRDPTVRVVRKKKVLSVERNILPGISTLCAYSLHDCGIKCTLYPGVRVPARDVARVTRKIMEINDNMIRGSFGVDDDRDVYFTNMIAAGDKMDYNVFLREVALGPKMIISHIGDIVAEIPDEADIDKGTDGDAYIVEDDDKEVD